MNEKARFILETIELLSNETMDNDTVQKSFEALKDSIAHTAPEVVGMNWNRLFVICKTHLNDVSNPSHGECLNIYNQRYKEYKAL